MTLPELAVTAEKLGSKSFAGSQIFRWLHQHGNPNFESMTDLPVSLRAKLASKFRISRIEIVHEQHSVDGTLKLLVKLEDSLKIETVLLKEQRRRTQCVSTQVGCPLGCIFCATASLGFKRNLTAGEIIAQIEDVQAYAGRAANLVFMGMGEPFLNYDNLLRAIRILNDRKGHDIGARRMTISTAGIPEGIRRFAQENLQVRLALSLNATTDTLRSRLMPVNKKYPLAETLDALEYYAEKTGRRSTIEYVLIPGENDSDEDLHRLKEITRDIKANINLIELNPGTAAYRPQSGHRSSEWKQALLRAGIETVIRFRRGVDIDAACGQLALRVSK